MHQSLRELLLRNGLAEAQLVRLEAAEEAPQTVADLGTSAESEADARAWAKELGLCGRIAVGRFVQAWQEARASSRIASGASERSHEGADAAGEEGASSRIALAAPEDDADAAGQEGADAAGEEGVSSRIASRASERSHEGAGAAPEDDADVAGQEPRKTPNDALELMTKSFPVGQCSLVTAGSADGVAAISVVETTEGSGASASSSSVWWSSGGGDGHAAPACPSASSSASSEAGSEHEAVAPVPAPAKLQRPKRLKKLQRPKRVKPWAFPPASSPTSAAAASPSGSAASSDPLGSVVSGFGGSKPAPAGVAHTTVGTKDDLPKMLASCPLFEGLSQQALREICKRLAVKEFKAGEKVVFCAGQHAQEMYFISVGEVEIRGNDGACLWTVRAGGFFGEVGVLYDLPHTADASAVVSRSPCRLHALSRQDLDKVASSCGCQQELRSKGQALQSVRSWFVAGLPLFARCAAEPGFVNAVANVLQVRTAVAREAVVTEGEEGHEMFFIFSGSVTVFYKQRRLQLSAPSFFGELALLYAEPRSATVRCAEACSFYVLNRDSLHRIMQEFPRVIGMMYSTAQEAASLKAHFIRKIPLFKAMVHNEEFIANMQLALKSSSAAPGEFLVRQGDASDGRMFLIAHGHAEVRKAKAPGEAAHIVATLGTGAIFGEVALLLDTPRVASVLACGHCHVYTLARDAFETLAVVYESWWKGLISERGVLLKQLQNTGIGISAAATTKTHNLQIPQLAGTAASTMLSAAEEPAQPCSVPAGRLCSVCRTQEKCILSVPCGHIAACAECHPALRNCPLCRQRIEKGVKAFF